MLIWLNLQSIVQASLHKPTISELILAQLTEVILSFTSWRKGKGEDGVILGFASRKELEGEDGL